MKPTKLWMFRGELVCWLIDDGAGCELVLDTTNADTPQNGPLTERQQSRERTNLDNACDKLDSDATMSRNCGGKGGEVLVGTSGWNYLPSGYGTWTGIFYPFKQAQRLPGTATKCDELAYYAARFRTVEINNTFYRPPDPKTARAWVERTPAGFEFSLKLSRAFTHARETTQVDIDTFRRGLEPLANAAKLGALLCHFPASFKRTSETVDYLTWLLQEFSAHRLAVEIASSFLVGRVRVGAEAPERAQGGVRPGRRAEVSNVSGRISA